MSDTMKEYIAEAEKDLLHTYNRYQIVLDLSLIHISEPTRPY